MICRLAAELISRALDCPLPFFPRTGLEIHTWVCGACRKYRRQLETLDDAFAELFAQAGGDDPEARLPEDTKSHLRSLVSDHLEREQ